MLQEHQITVMSALCLKFILESYLFILTCLQVFSHVRQLQIILLDAGLSKFFSQNDIFSLIYLPLHLKIGFLTVLKLFRGA